ncbi:MAG: pyridoxamine 5'-phosphate oxidase family protein [Actinomycetota bacterium]
MDLPSTDRTKARRMADRGSYDRELVYSILDEALICHVGFVDGGAPFVIPTIHTRIGDRLYLHGSPASRMLRTAHAADEICVTATILDGIVFARSALHHSMNYRSALVLGSGSEVMDKDEKMAVLEAVVEHVAPGRWEECRWPNERELRITKVVGLDLNEASAKVRTGGVKDDGEDRNLPVWAGVLPLFTAAGESESDPELLPEVGPSPSVAEWSRSPRR